MLLTGFASPAFLPTGIYYHCRHQLHAPRFFTSFRMKILAGRLHGAWRLPSFPCTNDTIATPPPCHFDRSGEISLPYAARWLRLSRLPAGMYLSSLPSLASCTEILHFVQNDGPGRKAPQRLPPFPRPNDTIATPPPCHFDRSGEISLLHGTSRIGAEDLSTQSFNRVQVHLPPLRHAAPLEMTEATGCTIVISKAAKK